MQFEYKRHLDKFLVLLMSHYHTKVSSFVKGNLVASSMCVSKPNASFNWTLKKKENSSELTFALNLVSLSSIALNEPTLDYNFLRLQKAVPRQPGDPDKLSKEMLLRRAADIAEAIYTPRWDLVLFSRYSEPLSKFVCRIYNETINFFVGRSPNSSSSIGTFNSYAQLAVSVQDSNAQWTEDDYQRTQTSSVSPRGGYCSSASTPHSSGGGSYGASSGNGYAPNMGTLSASSSSVFNSTSSKYFAFPHWPVY